MPAGAAAGNAIDAVIRFMLRRARAAVRTANLQFLKDRLINYNEAFLFR
jgi:hypothetical protein